MSKIMGFLKYISVYKIFSLGESWGMGERFQNVSKNFLENYICSSWFNTYTSNIFPEIWGEIFVENLETCRFVVRRLFSVVTRMVEIVKQYFIQRLITISNLLLQVIIILFHIFFSCFSKWNFIGYFLRQMSFKIYIDSRVSVLFSIPPTRKDFSVTDLTRNEKYFERILHGFVLLVLAGLYEYRSSQCLERTYRAKFGRFSAKCFIDWNRNVLFKIRSLFEIVFFFQYKLKTSKK